MLRRHIVRRHLADPKVRRRWLTLAFCLALTFVPLFGTLGYESALVLAPLSALGGMAVGVDVVRRRRTAAAATAGTPASGLGSSGTRARLVALLGEGLLEWGVLCLIALATLWLGELWQPSCDRLGGILFFAMGPVLSGVCGLVCGLWGGVLATRRIRALLVATLPMLFCLVVALSRLYRHPVVFAFDPFWGYFSGSIYDEAVSVGATYVRFRLYNALVLAVALGAWSLFVDRDRLRLRRPPRTPAHVVAMALVAAIAFAAAAIGTRAASLGFTADADSIAAKLAGTVETEHFVIHYAPRSVTARTLESVAAEHEFAWHRLRTITGTEPDGKVTSFVFTSSDQKRALMGAGRVQVAAPWRRQIYLDERPFPHPVLHHELAHIFGAPFGDDLLGISRDGLRINIGLLEGFATALAPRPADHLGLHDQAMVLERLGLRPPMAEIMGPGFFTRASRVAYTTAGSFCLWLLETRGFAPLGRLYANAGDFEAAYETPLETLEAQWLAFLNTHAQVTDADVEAQAQRFRQPSVFSRPCAHKVADVEYEIIRARARGDHEHAIEAFELLCELESERPEHRLGLANELATAGMPEAAEQVLAEVAARDLSVSLRAAVEQTRGDLALATSDGPAAAMAFERALQLPIGQGERRELELKRQAAIDGDLAPLILGYFDPFDTDSDGLTRAIERLFVATQIRDTTRYHALGSYLMARQVLNVERADAAIPLLQAALAPPPGDRGLPSHDFERAALEALLGAFVQVGRYDDARAVWARMAADPQPGGGDELELELWRQRIEFFASYVGAPSAAP